MDNVIYCIQKALDVVPICKGLVWGQVSAASDPFDASLKVALNGMTYTFHVQLRRPLHRAVIERVIALKNHLPPGDLYMLVTDQVSLGQAKTLSGNGVTFIDTAGNAYLDLPGLHVLVEGKKPAISAYRTKRSRTFYRTGLQLIFAFLTDPDLDKKPDTALLNKSFREIRVQTGVALGSIGTILASLLEQGYIIEDGNLRFLAKRKQLLERWVSDYVDHFRPKLISQRYRSRGGNWWEMLPSLGTGNYLGGEVAAAKLTGYLKPELTTLYTRGDTHRMILDADLRLDTEGDVEVLSAFWGDWPHGVNGDCVHPMLVYADLISSEIDRNMETAKRVYDKYLRDIIEPRG